MIPVQVESSFVNENVLAHLRSAFGERLQIGVPLARYTAARVGGTADILLEARSSNELTKAIELLWEEDLPYVILGGGSNVLVSDAGVRGVVLLNRARKVRFDTRATPPLVWAESGANLGLMARQAAMRGLAGLEWAAGIPGTLGGAIVGNAGAHGREIADNLVMAEILQCNPNVQEKVSQLQQWSAERLEFSYRHSLLKRQPGQAVVLTATLCLEASTSEAVQAKMEEYLEYRRKTQPPGASIGSMFKNPPGDYAGRLIEAAGLKGLQIGGAQISPLHANFFINHGKASAADIFALLQRARQIVLEKFGVSLELEIELIGEWPENPLA